MQPKNRKASPTLSLNFLRYPHFSALSSQVRVPLLTTGPGRPAVDIGILTRHNFSKEITYDSISWRHFAACLETCFVAANLATKINSTSNFSSLFSLPALPPPPTAPPYHTTHAVPPAGWRSAGRSQTSGPLSAAAESAPLPGCRAATPRRTGHLGCQMVTPAAPSGAAVESPPRPNGQIPAERVEGAGRSPVEPRRPGSVGKNVIKT